MSKDTPDKQSLGTVFKISIPGLQEMSFTSCQGLESEIQVINYHEGGSFSAAHTARGNQIVNRISFSHGINSHQGSSKTTLFDWYLKVLDSREKLEKKIISIEMLDEEEQKIAEWEIIKAWPCRWVGPLMNIETKSYACEFVSFAHEGITVK